MPTVVSLFVYPVKSCRGIAQSRVRLTRFGLEWDRRWMVVDGDGRFVSQRERAAMACIDTALTETELQVCAPHLPMLRIALNAADDGARRFVTIWKDGLAAIDEGDAAARWFSEALGAPVRLVRFDDSVQRRVSPRWTGDDIAFTWFADGFPLLVTAQESLDELNGRLVTKGAPAIPMDRFRPNLVLSGLEAYDEDFLDTLSVGTDGGIVLRFVKPCARCPIPTIDQSTGLRDPIWTNEPLATMATYRANRLVDGGLTFGQNAIVTAGEGEWLHAGQLVQSEWNFPDDD